MSHRTPPSCVSFSRLGQEHGSHHQDVVRCPSEVDLYDWSVLVLQSKLCNRMPASCMRLLRESQASVCLTPVSYHTAGTVDLVPWAFLGGEGGGGQSTQTVDCTLAAVCLSSVRRATLQMGTVSSASNSCPVRRTRRSCTCPRFR